MALNIRTEKVIDSFDWDNLVQETYGRKYCYQQQDDCRPRGTYRLSVPSVDYDFENDSVPEIVNGDEMGVSFQAWLARDPKQKLPNQEFDYELELFWERNFYPTVESVANDLHKKGLLKEGKYTINVDW